MRYEKLFEKGNYAIILRGQNLNEYAVVYGLNEESGDWCYTVGCWSFVKWHREYGYITQFEALNYAIEAFRCSTEENYISRYRLEELASKFADGLIQDDEESAMEYFTEECEMEDYELEFFGIETESKDDEEYMSSAENGDYSPSNPWNAPGMSISDFI